MKSNEALDFGEMGNLNDPGKARIFNLHIALRTDLNVSKVGGKRVLQPLSSPGFH